jgi:hypothetical protein
MYLACKSYKVILEFIKIKIISENIDCINKNITVNSKSKHIIINIQRLDNKIDNIDKQKSYVLPNLNIKNKAILYEDIIKYWLQNSDNITCNLFKIFKISETKSLKINEDYFVVPCYIINNLLVLGIIILDVNKYNCKILETYNYLSTLNPICKLIHTHKLDIQLDLDIHLNSDSDIHLKLKQWNIINGILNYRINSSNSNLLSNEILKDKFFKIIIHNNQKDITLSIKWEYIFRNIANYLPKFTIIYKSQSKIITNFFQNHLNP